MRKFRKFLLRDAWRVFFGGALLSYVVGRPLLGPHLWRWAVFVGLIVAMATLNWWRARRARIARRRRREARRLARQQQPREPEMS